MWGPCLAITEADLLNGVHIFSQSSDKTIRYGQYMANVQFWRKKMLRVETWPHSLNFHQFGWSSKNLQDMVRYVNCVNKAKDGDKESLHDIIFISFYVTVWRRDDN